MGRFCVIFDQNGEFKIILSLILHLDTGKIQNTYYEIHFGISSQYSLVSELCPAIATKNVHLIGEHVSYLRKQYD